MNKYIAWNEIIKDKIEWEELVDLDKTHDLSLVGLILDEDPYIKLFQSTGKTDIHDKEIYYDFHVVKFKLKDKYIGWVEQIGIFHFNEDELRAEINMLKFPNLDGFWYVADVIKDFEIIGNVKQNPELIGEGK